MSGIITLLTDFGTTNGYVGAMKGAILSIAPEAVLVDISHDVPPQDVRFGAFTHDFHGHVSAGDGACRGCRSWGWRIAASGSNSGT